MSTDLHDRTTNPSPEPREPEKPKPTLSFAQVAGGALAAMTAAALGSRLSIAGTVVGAALASVVAAVAGSVYTSSLRRTHDRVSAVWKGRGQPVGAPTGSDAPTAPGGSAADVGDDHDTHVDGRPTAAAAYRTEQAAEPTKGPGRRKIGWKPVLAGALLMFAIAAVALTGLELATGRALSGGSGTTVGQVTEGKTAPSSKPTKPATTPSATPTSSASSEPTATPSATPTSEPTSDPTPTASAAPSSSAVPTPTATVSGSAPIPSEATTP